MIRSGRQALVGDAARHRHGALEGCTAATVWAAGIGGLRAVIVHAKDAQARSFYETFGFERSSVDDLHFMPLLKDVRRIVMGSQ